MRIRLQVLGLAVCLLMAACAISAAPTSTHTATATTPTASTTTAAMSTTVPAATSTTRLARPFYERSCASRIGVGYGPPGTEIAIYEVGPLSFLALDVDETASMRPAEFDPADGRHRALEYVAVVDGDAFGPIVLLLDPRHRSSAGLAYDPDLRDGRLASTDSMVRFEGCPGSDAQFNGGFLVTEPMCLYFSVIESGNYPPLVSFGAIPFGVPRETCEVSDDG